MLLGSPAREVRAAEPPDAASCISSYEDGQRRRRDGDLLGARSSFRTCATETCPDLARRDCLEWERDLESTIPSVVVGARTAAGSDVTDLALKVDGRLVQSRLSGVPVEVNPGAHVVAIEDAAGASKEQHVIVRSGEKNRLVSFVVDGPGASDSAHASSHAAAVETPRSSSPFPWILAGAGAALSVAGITLEAVGVADVRSLREDCAPSCSKSSVDAARYTIIAGDVLLATGVAALIGGIYLVVRTRATGAGRGGARW